MSDISAKIISIESSDDAVASARLAAEEKPMSVQPTIPATPKAAPLNVQSSTTGIFTALIWGAALLWLGCVLAAGFFTFGLPSPLSSVSALQWIGFTALIIFPIAMLFTLGSLAKRLAVMSETSRNLIAAADSLTRPDAVSEHRAASLAGAIRSQIIGVDSDLKASMDRLAGMETVLVGHTDALSRSHIAATRQTGEITKRLSEERTALKQVTTSFDERMGALSRLLTEHSDRLANATHVAEQKIQEARVSVEGAAAKINASSEIVRDNALTATHTLSESHSQITNLGQTIQSQSAIMDEINSRHAAELSALVERLETEQMRMSEAIAQRLNTMRDMSLSAKLSADTLNEASDAGRQTIEALAESASLADNAVKKRFSEMEEMVQFSNASAESLTERAAKRVRDSLSLTRLEISRIEDDMRALEERLTTNSLDFTRRETAVDVTPPKGNWRKSLLRFRPADDETEAPSPKANDDGKPASVRAPLTLTAPMQDDVPQKAAAPKVELEIPRPGTTEKLDLSSDPAPNLSAPLDKPAEPVDRDPLSLEMNTIEPHSSQTAPLFNDTLETLGASRIDPPELRPRQSKKGWSLRNMFGAKTDVPTSSAAPRAPSVPTRSWEETQADIVTRLSAIGLAPNAVVEAGCIIEAVNSRVAKGSGAMREVVSLRLPQPTEHLREAMANDPQLRANCIDFARRYYQVFSTLEGDREAMRTELETQTGRAYLLCDAALG